jgi:hypothetical protein
LDLSPELEGDDSANQERDRSSVLAQHVNEATSDLTHARPRRSPRRVHENFCDRNTQRRYKRGTGNEDKHDAGRDSRSDLDSKPPVLTQESCRQ